MKRRILMALCLLFSLLLLLILFLFGTEKGYELRKYAAETILSTQHREWAKWTFLPQEELDRILDNIQNPKYINTIVSPHLSDDSTDSSNIQQTEKGFPEVGDELTVSVESIEAYYNPSHFYEGKVMTISNPHNVQLTSSSMKNHGEQIFVQAQNVGAIAATNASGFYDLNGTGNGGTSIGIVIEKGVITNPSDGRPTLVAALTETGQMLTGKYSAKELIKLNVQYAAGFKPQLIANGEKLITDGDGGWGAGPRTAIGQTKDGTIILVVIEGRQTHSIGATIKEVQNILYDRGVINAMSMDGGSSSSMYLDGKNITTPSSVGNIPRYLPNIWSVIPKEGQKVKVVHDGKTIINQKSYKKD